jgi:hypothetical protein
VFVPVVSQVALAVLVSPATFAVTIAVITPIPALVIFPKIAVLSHAHFSLWCDSADCADDRNERVVVGDARFVEQQGGSSHC